MPSVSLQTLLQNNLPLGYTGSRGQQGALGFTGSRGYTGSIGVRGSQGFTGSRGPQGVNVSILGSVATVNNLPSDGTSDGSSLLLEGQGFIVSETGDFYVWYNNEWNNVGRIVGYTGSQGDLGYTGSIGIGFTGSLGFTGSRGFTGFTGSRGDTGFVGSVGNFASIQDIDEYTSSTYTIQTTDIGKVLSFDNAVKTTITLSADAFLSWTIGQRVDIVQSGLGFIEIIPQVGVTLNHQNTSGNAIINRRYTTGTLIKTAANEWIFITPSEGSLGYTGSRGDTGFIGSQGFTGSQGDFSAVQQISEITSNYTLQLADAGDLLRVSSSSTVIVTIPNDSSVNFPAGQRVDIMQEGTGGVAIEASAGVTIYNSGSGSAINSQYTSMTLIKLSANTWITILPDAGDQGFTGSRGDVGFTGSQGYTGSEGGFDNVQLFNNQTGTSYTLVASDRGKIVRLDNANTITLTIPEDSTLDFPAGGRIDIVQVAGGSVAISAASGVTLDSYQNNAQGLSSINSTGTLIKTESNRWLFVTGVGAPPGFTGSQGTTGFTGSAGPATGYTGSQGDIGYTGSQGGIGFSGSQGEVGFTGSSGAFAAVGFTGSIGFTGSAGQITLERHYNIIGVLSASTGTSRWWVQSNQVINQIRAQVGTSPVGSSISISIKKNGTPFQSISVASGQSSTSINTNLTINDGDYLTVDIVSVGSTTPGADLVVSFLYTRV